MIVYSDIKIVGSNRMGLSPSLITELNNGAKNNFTFFIPKEKWPLKSRELNPMDYSIWTKISSDVEYGTINDLRREIEKKRSGKLTCVIYGK